MYARQYLLAFDLCFGLLLKNILRSWATSCSNFFTIQLLTLSYCGLLLKSLCNLVCLGCLQGLLRAVYVHTSKQNKELKVGKMLQRATIYTLQSFKLLLYIFVLYASLITFLYLLFTHQWKVFLKVYLNSLITPKPTAPIR